MFFPHLCEYSMQQRVEKQKLQNHRNDKLVDSQHLTNFKKLNGFSVVHHLFNSDIILAGHTLQRETQTSAV